MSNNNLGKDEVLYILNDMKEDIKNLDEKWARSLEEGAQQRQILEHLQTNVGALYKVLILGNGQPSLIVKVNDLSKDVDTLKTNHEKLIKSVKVDKGPNHVKIERLKLAGKFVGLLCIIAAEATAVLTILQSCQP